MSSLARRNKGVLETNGRGGAVPEVLEEAGPARVLTQEEAAREGSHLGSHELKGLTMLPRWLSLGNTCASLFWVLRILVQFLTTALSMCWFHYI